MLREQTARGNAGKAVSLEKLTNQLRRDIAANPKKAAALGVMIVVALYFWGPLIWGWLPANDKTKPKVDVASLILTDDPADPNQAAKGRSNSQFRWEKVRQLIGEDSQMASATFDAAWIDPFGKPAPARPETAAEATTTAAATKSETAPEPTAAGLVLGGIMIGPRTKVATINGEACHEGDTLTVTDTVDKSQNLEFRVARINRRQVEVECQGRTFVLEVGQAKLASGDDIGRNPPKRNER